MEGSKGKLQTSTAKLTSRGIWDKPLSLALRASVSLL